MAVVWGHFRGHVSPVQAQPQMEERRTRTVRKAGAAVVIDIEEGLMSFQSFEG